MRNGCSEGIIIYYTVVQYKYYNTRLNYNFIITVHNGAVILNVSKMKTTHNIIFILPSGILYRFQTTSRNIIYLLHPVNTKYT